MKKKICFVVPTHHSYQQGGAQYQVQTIIEQLLKFYASNFEVYYITQRADNKTNEPYKLFILNGKIGKKYGQVFNAPSLISILKKINPDVIYQRIAGAYTGICAYYCKKHNKKMIFHIAHDVDVNIPEQNKYIKLKKVDAILQNYGIRNASIIIAQTTNQSDLLEKYFNRKPDLNVYNFHPLPSTKSKYHHESNIKISWIANFKPFKQPEIFIKIAATLINRKDIQFIMIGKLMGNEEYQRQFLEVFSRSPSIQYLGEITIDDVNDYLTQCDLLINTSIAEGFSNTFIQAWMRGVPVYSLNANPDYLFDKYPVLGRCFNNDFEALEKAVSQFNKISEANFEEMQLLAADLFSISNCKKIIDLFD